MRRNHPESYTAEGQGIEMLQVRDAHGRGEIMEECIRWCQRCGGDLCYTKKGVVCLDCFARGNEVFGPVNIDEEAK